MARSRKIETEQPQGDESWMFVVMVKDGVSMAVHHTTVQSHKDAGWKVEE